MRGLTLDDVQDPTTHLGQVVDFGVQGVKSGKNGIVVSRRAALQKLAREKTRERLANLKVGDEVKGKVTHFLRHGVLLDMDGVAGLIPLAEVAWERRKRAKDILVVGQEVDVKVLEMPSKKKDGKDGRDAKERHRAPTVTVSLKALQPDPWQVFLEKSPVGLPHRGVVRSMTEFGAFIELVAGVEGLMPMSEIETAFDGEPVPGQAIHVVVDAADPNRRRISLSKMTDDEVKRFEAGELREVGPRTKLRPGSAIDVEVDSADLKGVTVRVPGVLGKRGQGFIRPGDTGTVRGTDLRKKFPAGTKLRVKLVGISPDSSLKCSIKALAQDEEREAIRHYKKEAQSQKMGTLGDLLGKLNWTNRLSPEVQISTKWHMWPIL